jgi:hypothetical protein
MSAKLPWAVKDSLTTREAYLEKLQSYPRHHVYQTNRNTKCKFCEQAQHKRLTQYAECKVKDCKVKYKFISCEFASKRQISMSDEHNHTNEHIRQRGMAAPFKQIVNDLLEKRVTQPKVFVSTKI